MQKTLLKDNGFFNILSVQRTLFICSTRCRRAEHLEQRNSIVWRNNQAEFEAWCKDQTGYPIVDAGMRELNHTGWMHNRVRMIVASFLTKHLLIDWRWGEAYFAEKLLDFELASNNGGWQLAAGCGVDAAPYFRIFNPKLQTEKFDPKFIYSKVDTRIGYSLLS
jgi:deoxyribodipyrimidine photo-lyase